MPRRRLCSCALYYTTTVCNENSWKHLNDFFRNPELNLVMPFVMHQQMLKYRLSTTILFKIFLI